MNIYIYTEVYRRHFNRPYPASRLAVHQFEYQYSRVYRPPDPLEQRKNFIEILYCNANGGHRHPGVCSHCDVLKALRFVFVADELSMCISGTLEGCLIKVFSFGFYLAKLFLAIPMVQKKRKYSIYVKNS